MVFFFFNCLIQALHGVMNYSNLMVYDLVMVLVSLSISVSKNTFWHSPFSSTFETFVCMATGNQNKTPTLLLGASLS